jgi:hypothetical protein
MPERTLAVVVLALFASLASAQPYQGSRSTAQPQVQDRLVNAYGQGLADYAFCLQATGNANRCGAASETVRSVEQRHAGQPDVRVTD